MATEASDRRELIETGHAGLDEQHRHLLTAHAAALRQARAGDLPAIRTSLRALLELTQQHFAFEERLMVESGYAGRWLHARAHGAFVRDLLDVVDEVEHDAGASAVCLWLESRYEAWWRHHVRANDALLASHLGCGSAPTQIAARAR